MPFAVRRARRGMGSLATLALVAAIATACIAMVGALADRAFDRGVDEMLALADPRDRTVVVELPLGADPAAEAQTLATGLEDALAGQPVGIRRTTIATGSTVIDGVPTSLDLLSDATASDRAELLEGDWPGSADEVAIAEPAATRLGLAVGEPLGDSGLRVAGIWRASDPADPAWSGDPAVASGVVDGAVGPILVQGDSAIAEAPRLKARWTVAPQSLTVASAARLGEALGRVDAVANSPAGTSSAGPARVQDGLSGTLARTLAAVSGARTALAVPVVALGVIAAVIVGVVVFALGRAREGETALVVARGARRRTLWASAVAEISVAGVVGAGAGAAVALLAAPPGTAFATAAAVGAGAIVVGAGVAASAVLRPIGMRRARTRPLTAGPLLVLVGLAVAAGLALAQAFVRGGLVDAGGRVDPLAVAAPWLVLLALCLVATLLAGPAAAAAERVTRHGRGLATRLGVLQLARRPQSVLAGVLCLALAGGVLALAATLATGAGERADAAAAAVGADVRAGLDAQRTVDDTHVAPLVAELQGAPGITAAEPAVSIPVGVDDADAVLLATSPEGFALLGAPDASALPAGRAAPLSGDELTVEVRGDYAPSATQAGPPPTATMTVAAWAVDKSGAPRQLHLGTVPADGAAHVVSAPLAGATGLLAVDVEGEGLGGGRAQVRVAASDAAGPLQLEGVGSALTSGQAVRVPAVLDLPAEIPAVVTASLARRVDAPVGGILHLDAPGTSRDLAVRVVAVVDVLPGVGSGPAVAVDLRALTASRVTARDAVLSPTTVFVAADDEATASRSVRAWAAHPVRVQIATDAAARPVSQPALALFAAVALAGAALGTLGFAVVMGTTARDRRAEAVPLRSFGFGDAAQRRARLAETASAAGFALVAGALAGWATGLVIAPILLPALTGAAG